MSDDTNRLAGVAWISMDGQNYMLSGELAYSPADYERESMVGQDRVHGYAEKPRAPFISATLRDAGTLTVKDFNAMTNVTVTLELANGKTVVGRNMWSTEAQEVRTPEATFEIRFEGFSGSVTEQ
ncbi:hypothetical protein OKW43_005146 [Paraburkholderia sp. WC7.3g]|uniref:phage tail tube protein n=1 Tax=unclassified Paraburkholderia TaxID=2615204 RepID=UPI00161C8651|nr:MULTISPECIES: phage tail tube protein [unclassified Paraburkholderia]MBB5411700.1 hypothetical protein [Paraburkholderia sp. HC6.4b]MBB5453271.1 hypothetical protein [Paraburkholderia sp. Kb1A]MBC8729443.1 phage tail protein [Paraburkholderia sp. UCT2]